MSARCSWHESGQMPCQKRPTHTAEDLPQDYTWRLCAEHARRYVELGLGKVWLGVKLHPSEILEDRLERSMQTATVGHFPPIQLSRTEAENLLEVLKEASGHAVFAAVHGMCRMLEPPWYAALEREKGKK